MLNHPMPGQPVKVQADMGSDNARVVHKHGGKLSGNQYKVLTHIAWTAYDRKGIPGDAKDRDGNPAKPFQFFASAQASAMDALGDDKDPYVALKAWETAIRELIKLGLLRRVERAVPRKRTALYELNIEAVEALRRIDESGNSGRENLPEVGRKILPEVEVEGRENLPESTDAGRKILRHTNKLLNNQVQASNQPSRLTTGSRRAISSPRAREPKLIAQDADASAYDEARQHLGNLSPERSEHVMEQARQALGPDAPLRDRIMHAAQLAGHNQEHEAP